MAVSEIKFKGNCTKLQVSSTTDAKPENYQKSIEERIQAGISFAKVCCLIKKLPGVVIAVMGSNDGAGKADSVRKDIQSSENIL